MDRLTSPAAVATCQTCLCSRCTGTARIESLVSPGERLPCPSCDATGRRLFCPKCDGVGMPWLPDYVVLPPNWQDMRCNTCGGSGRMVCPDCDDSGRKATP